MTNADTLRANALHEVGEEYEWSNVGTGGVAGSDEYDCSGFSWAMWNQAGYKIARMTADSYYHLGKRIGSPSMVGDYFILLEKGTDHAHHIGLYVGLGQTVEAKGEAFGVVASTVAAVNARGAIWMRLPGAAFGSLTSKEEPVMDCLFIIVTGSAANLGTVKAHAEAAKLWASEVTPGELWVHARKGDRSDKLLAQLASYKAFRGGKVKTVPTYSGSFRDIKAL